MRCGSNGGLEISIQYLIDEIKSREQTMAELENQQKILEDTDLDLDKKIVIKKTIRDMEAVTKHYAMNCKKCKKTCHVPCKNPYDFSFAKYWCEIFTWGGDCTGCDCPPKQHEPSKQKHVMKTIEVQTTKRNLVEMHQDSSNIDIKKRLDEYRQTKQDCDQRKAAIQNLETKVKQQQVKILRLVIKIRDLHNELFSMALRPQPLTDMAYLDILIEDEKNHQKDGWRRRLNMLEKCKTAAETYTTILEGNIENISEKISQNEDGMFRSENDRN